MARVEGSTDLWVDHLLNDSKIDLDYQSSHIKNIDDALHTASKKLNGKSGYPEYVGVVKDYLLVIEDKADISNHVYTDHDVITTDDPMVVPKYALNGALHYARHILERTSYKKCFAFGVSGNEKLHKITPMFINERGDYDVLPDEGDIPFIASGASLNGSVKFCRPHENEVPDASNCITVSPVDGSSFYQSTEFLGRGGGGSSIIMLRSQRLNKYNGIFMARAINNTTSKYQYGHMATSDGIKRDRVLLPIDAQGQPDYDYMEQYVKNKMIQKYNNYLQYLNAR